MNTPPTSLGVLAPDGQIQTVCRDKLPQGAGRGEDVRAVGMPSSPERDTIALSGVHESSNAGASRRVGRLFASEWASSRAFNTLALRVTRQRNVGYGGIRICKP